MAPDGESFTDPQGPVSSTSHTCRPSTVAAGRLNSCSAGRLYDLGHLGALGALPGWPGPDVFPAQPMVGQIRAVLDRYQAAGGKYTELVLANCGHSPHLEQPAEFGSAVTTFLDAHG